MATVADYITLANAPIDLHQTVVVAQKFPLTNLPNNINSSSPAILSFMVEVQKAKGVGLHLGIGPSNIPPPAYNYNWTVNYLLCTLQHHWNSPLSKQDFLHVWRAENPVGSATVLTVSNIVLWFRVNA